MPISAQSNNYFEGDMVYRNFENYSKLTRKLASGSVYNGAKTVKIILKGVNVHIIDETSKMHTLLLPNEDKAIIFCDYIKKGQQFKYSEYVDRYMSTFSSDRNVSTVKDIGEQKKLMGQDCERYKGVITDNDVAVCDVELFISSKYNVHESYYSFLNGIQVSGIVMKWTWNHSLSMPLFGKMKSYVASEVKEIHERPVSDDEMKVPEGYEIKISSSPFKFLGLFKANNKYMKKNKLYPDQKDSDVTFSVDNDWNF
jgi:hypothetical protein